MFCERFFIKQSEYNPFRIADYTRKCACLRRVQIRFMGKEQLNSEVRLRQKSRKNFSAEPQGYLSTGERTPHKYPDTS